MGECYNVSGVGPAQFGVAFGDAEAGSAEARIFGKTFSRPALRNARSSRQTGLPKTEVGPEATDELRNGREKVFPKIRASASATIILGAGRPREALHPRGQNLPSSDLTH